MEFDEVNKVIVESMNSDECIAFIKFLDSEIIRHEIDIKQAIQLKYKVMDRIQELTSHA